METLAAIISVYAQFPHRGPRPQPDQLGVERISLISCQQTQLPPIFVKFFRWIRYATGIVMGVHGELCVSCDLIDSPSRYIMILLSNPRPIHAGSVLFDVLIHEHTRQIGRASCRERVLNLV